ncbi:MAG: gluconokinase [Cyanobacteria bacterium P01_D01_bin.6]
MGVSGSGKTTVGRCLADALDWHFVEGDDWHPSSNVAKMSRGIPLTDHDRWPWLLRLRDHMRERLLQQQSAIVTCSTLKQSYREVLRPDANEPIQFVYLKGNAATLRMRLQQRHNHFMKADLLDSQLATLEEPADAIVIDIDIATTPAQVVTHVISQLNFAHRAEIHS